MKCVNCNCDPAVLDRGVVINRLAFLGSSIVSLKEQIPRLEKQSRKTPPKTLQTEWEKVRKSKMQLEASVLLLKALEEETIQLRSLLQGPTNFQSLP